LKGHKEEIRALAVKDGNTLISAGKGSNTSGSLLIWDIRKGQNFEEREKNQDVFSLAVANNTLFMGCRNHYVYPINL
jgi:WD40 repeat protein